MYPLKFYPIYKEILWGGRNLERLGRVLPQSGRIAESWELSVRRNDQSIISNGGYRGRRLVDIINDLGTEMTGDRLPADYAENFPLFFKLIDANADLSIQLHPTDEYARVKEGERYGKDESWVILSCEKDARLVYGLKAGTGIEEFAMALKNGEAQKYLNYVDVEPGDVFNIYPGLVHGIGKGIVLAEIQQNSNTTYRLYDYDRVDDEGKTRELHLDKALEVINTEKKYSFIKIPGHSTIDGSGNVSTGYVMKERYILEKLDVENELIHDTANERFYIYFVTEGEGSIWSGGTDTPVKSYETIMIPACLGEYRIRGRIKLLRAYIRQEEEIKEAIQRDFAYFSGKLPIAT